ncbi:MAG TPA: hypothetical protein VMN82_04745 [Thermoanaerobaculia bacterium]|nr:hypothetical protein [Thermoanaerobaculia bacterium]
MAEIAWFDALLEETLSGVGFFVDYVQLHFNLNPLLNVYTPILVTARGATQATGDPGFANALLGQMKKRVARVSIEAQKNIAIHFADASTLSFATAKDGAFPESFTLFTDVGIFEE